MTLRAGFHGTVGQSSAQFVDGSLIFDSGSSNILKRTPGSAGNRNTWTLSTWIKRDTISTSQHPLLGGGSGTGHGLLVRFSPSSAGNDTIQIGEYISSWQWQLITSRVFRDPGWYHIVIAVDTTLSTSSDRVKLYINGTRETSFGTASYPSSSYNTYWNTATLQVLGGQTWNGAVNGYYNGKLSNAYFVDGQQLGPRFFGFIDPLTGTWRPKRLREGDSSINDGTVWSDGTITGTSGGSAVTILNPERAFNGNFVQYARFSHTANNDSIITWTPPGGAISGKQLRIWCYQPQGTSGANQYLKINNGPYVIDSNNWANVSANTEGWSKVQTIPDGLLTSITLKLVYGGSSNQGIYAIEIDGEDLRDTAVTAAFGTNGFYLPMDGNSPIGQDKSEKGNDWDPSNFGTSNSLHKATGALPILNTVNGGNHAAAGTRPVSEGFPNAVVNDGTVWSTATVSGDGSIDGSYPVANAFNGSLAVPNMRSSGTNTNITLTLPKSIPFTSSIRIYQNQNGTAKINSESTVSTSSGGASWVTVYSGSGTFSSLTLTSTGGDTVSLYAVEVDGEILVDGNGLVFALPLIGNANDVSNQINSASSTKTVTVTGPTASSDESNFYGGSFDFDGSNDYLSASSSDLGFEAGDAFTIEGWFYADALPSNGSGSGGAIFGNRENTQSDSFTCYIGSSATNTIGIHVGGGTVTYFSAPGGLSTDRWFHLAMVRNTSNTVEFFLDGVSLGTGTPASDLGNGAMYIGCWGSGRGAFFNGHIQDFRVYKGLAKYNGNFIPASTNPVILPDTPSGVSGGYKLPRVTDGAVHFDASGDYLEIADSSDFAFGTGDFTAECFIYPKGNVNYRAIIDCRDQVSDPNGWILGVNAADQIYIYTDGFLLTSADGNTVTTEDKWYHVAYVRNSGTHKLYVDGKEVDSSSTSIDYNTDNCVIGASYAKNSEYWNGLISNVRLVKGTAVYTSDFTPPTRALANVTNTKLLCCQSNTQPGAGSTTPNMGGVNNGTQWGAFLTRNDTSKSWIRQTSMFNGAIDDLSTTVEKGFYFEPPSPITGITSLRINFESPSDGYRFTLNDNTQKTGSGTISRQWIDLSTEISTEGGTLSKINFERPGSGGNTYPYVFAVEVNGVNLVDPLTPNGDVIATNFSPFNTNINTVLGQESVYPTLNPLFRSGSYSNGNLTQTTTSGNGHYRANVGINSSSGKFYFEYEPTGSNVVGQVGLCTNGHGISNNLNGNSAYCYYGVTGYKQGGLSAVDSAYGATYAFGDVIGVAFDTYNGGSLEFFKNGVSQGVAFSNEFLFFPYYPAFSAGSSSNTTTYNANFGQRPFKFPPPDGYQPLTLSISDVPSGTMIARADQYVGVTTYTGSITDTSSQTVTGINFQSDLVWIKRRDGSNSHQLVDSVRGAGNWLESSGTAIENSTNTNGVLTSFNSNGFTLTGGSTNANLCCESGFKYVAWCWKAGGGKPGGGGFFKDGIEYASASAAGLTAGTITPDGASVGTKQGFSIVEFAGNQTAGAKVPHGLSQTPNFTIVKQLTGTTESWRVRHSSINPAKTVYLNQTVSETSNTEYISGADSTTITLSTGLNGINGNNDYIMYAWHDVPGLQKFGDYQNPSSVNGAFVELGFKPAVLIIKCVRNISSSSGAGDWVIKDIERSPFNNPDDGNTLVLNVTNGEDSYYNASQASIDILSNGFKIRHPNSSPGGDPGRLYIYAAWAEAPAINLYGGQSTAR